jgi:hypothetical protein
LKDWRSNDVERVHVRDLTGICIDEAIPQFRRARGSGFSTGYDYKKPILAIGPAQDASPNKTGGTADGVPL